MSGITSASQPAAAVEVRAFLGTIHTLATDSSREAYVTDDQQAFLRSGLAFRRLRHDSDLADLSKYAAVLVSAQGENTGNTEFSGIAREDCAEFVISAMQDVAQSAQGVHRLHTGSGAEGSVVLITRLALANFGASTVSTQGLPEVDIGGGAKAYLISMRVGGVAEIVSRGSASSAQR